MKIDKFIGEYRWLSNFENASVFLDGEEYPSTEHAYQAAKTLDPKEREAIRKEPRAGKVKRMGTKVKLRPDWESVKLGIMYDLNLQKFTRHLDLKIMLLATGDLHIEEGNDWGDTYWGTVKGKGENHLGKILMRVRKDIS